MGPAKSFRQHSFAKNTHDLTVYSCIMQVWLVGEDLTEEEQSMASKRTIFIPFSQFPPKKTRKDCVYLHTPSMVVPASFGNLHSCEVSTPISRSQFIRMTSNSLRHFLKLCVFCL